MGFLPRTPSESGMPESDRERTLNRPSIRDGYHDSSNLYNDRRVIRWLFFGSWALIDLTLLQPLSSIRRKQKVVDTNATVVFKGPPEVVPESVLASFARMERTECVDISQAEHRAVTGPRLRLKQCVMNPRGRFVAVYIFWNDVEVATNNRRNSTRQPCLHLQGQAIHPCQLVCKFLGSDRVAVREVNIHQVEAFNHHFQET